MDGGFGFNSSQQSLPLPQDAFDALWDIVNADGNEHLFRDMSQAVTAPVQMQPFRSSLPATSDWPGDYGFNVTFGQTDATKTKNIHWIYRDAERKLYIDKDVPCPINFSVSYPMLPGAVVRAMAVYTSPQHASESVHRCVYHSMGEINANVFEAEHLLRSECRGAEYVQHEDSKRHSVTVPFENPPAGQCFSTYIYKFACLGSCAGGPNRRPLTLVFTLEQNNMVVGRRSIHLRICANPGRDSGAVTKRQSAQSKKAPMAKKIETDCPQQVSVPKRKIKENETYTVQTSDPECYEFLRGMKKWHKISRRVSSLPRDYLYLLGKMVSSSESDFSN